jgi:hypothetical protein
MNSHLNSLSRLLPAFGTALREHLVDEQPTTYMIAVGLGGNANASAKNRNLPALQKRL